MPRPPLKIALRAVSVVVAIGLVAGCSSRGERVESSPAPSPDEVPASAAEWADQTFGTFETVSFEGDGEEQIDLPAEVAAAPSALVSVSYEGSSPMTLWAVDADDEQYMILLDSFLSWVTPDPAVVNADATWGVANEPPSALLVEADGAWTITVAPISSAPSLPDSGTGVRVYLYDGAGGDYTGTASDTEVGVSVVEVRPGPDGTGGGRSGTETVDVKEGAPAFAGTLSAGPSLVFVNYRGDWTISLP